MERLGHREFLVQDYAIVNSMQVLPNHYADLDTVCLLPRGWDRHRRMMPLLVELKKFPERRRLELLERADRWSLENDMPFFSALLVCSTNVSLLASHLRRQMVLSRPGAQRAWLRFHDPRVFRHLRWLLTPAQMTVLLGPVQCWTWFETLECRWHSQPSPETELQPSSISLNPTSAQWAALDQFDALNLCLRDIMDESDIPPTDEMALKLADALVEAASIGLQDIADKGLYARQRLVNGTNADFQEATRRRLSMVNAEGMSYVAACRMEGASNVGSDPGLIGVLP
ncbi:DUF4123 domain-containing protein [Stenotrophomonas sp. MMGLT7]|uniref:DUF4123 domain-containing protein n=1 Tax=Stenotrophomonas sp. MMGLT7 TaxID=2901227 RepID=UPI001E37177C|nr:DUF4123 domain-containing protein [Stenotrophomonas sp. MMGLT7]MCD7100423.1 DUF4123 domain-containing protein [Stenotrophomonas sp. MMGLT7]